jgi:hypothetical protein
MPAKRNDRYLEDRAIRAAFELSWHCVEAYSANGPGVLIGSTLVVDGRANELLRLLNDALRPLAKDRRFNKHHR